MFYPMLGQQALIGHTKIAIISLHLILKVEATMEKSSNDTRKLFVLRTHEKFGDRRTT